MLALATALAAAPVSAGPADDPANWRKLDSENLLQLTIKRQDVLIELRPDFAPGHVEQIKKIARAGHYNSLPFHRVIDDFMAQGGEVSAIYMLSTPYPNLRGEFTFRRAPAQTPVTWVNDPNQPALKTGVLDGFVVASQPDEAAELMADGKVETWALHCPGIASMARSNDPDSADTQFFLMRQSSDFLDKTYTVWGRAVNGLDIIRGIKAGPEETDGRMQPSVADKLSRATIVADLPDYRRPTVWVERTDGPNYRKRLEEAMAAPRDGVCAVPSPEVIVDTPVIE
jgi:peptidylprolyl isomerase